MSPTTIAILSLIISPFLAALGSYIGVRVTLARHDEKFKAHDQKFEDHGERIKRLEGVYFGGKGD